MGRPVNWANPGLASALFLLSRPTVRPCAARSPGTAGDVFAPSRIARSLHRPHTRIDADRVEILRAGYLILYFGRAGIATCIRSISSDIAARSLRRSPPR